MTPKTVLVRRTHYVDLECCGMFKLEQGRTYFDDGTTLLDVYIDGGIAEGWLEKTGRGPDTITVSARYLLKS
jgi:hypothetical protein